MKLFVRHKAFSLWLKRFFAVVSLSVFGSAAGFAQAGNALQLNGSNQYASRSPVVSTITDDFTMEAWVKWDGTRNGQNKILFYNGNTSSSGFGVFISSSYELDVLFGGNAVLNSGFYPEPGRWYHIALTQDYPNTRLWVDGHQVSNWDGWGPNFPSGTTVAGANQGGTELFDGQIDELRLWSTARSQAEIVSTASIPLIGSETNLIGLWHFNETAADTVAESVNQLKLTTTNSPVFVASGAMGVGAPGLVKIVSGHQSVTLRWNPSLLKKKFHKYYIAYDVDPNPSTIMDSTSGGNALDTTKVISGLTDFTKYYFRVAALDSNGTVSGFSNEVSATPSPFVENTSAAFVQVVEGDFVWGDYDNDGDYDVFVTGSTDENSYDDGPYENGVAKLYRHDGTNFTEVNTGFLQQMHRSSAAWGDYNNDGLLDLAYMGSTGNGSRTLKLYRNNADGTFTDVPHSMQGATLGMMAWGDYDNDGDQDLLVMGTTGNSGWNSTFLYRNDGNGQFNPVDIGLPGYNAGSVAWGDYDNDQDLDILILGTTDNSYSGGGLFIYRNDNNGSFSLLEEGFPSGLHKGEAVWGDFDNDGDLDITFTGATGSGNRTAGVYRNDGDDIFTDVDAGFTGLARATVSVGDYDNDGDLDIFMAGTAGSEGSGPELSYIYRNDGGNTFTAFNLGYEIEGYYHIPSSAFIDEDRDGDLDLMIMGNSQNGYVTKLYDNQSAILNTPPGDPTGLSSSTSSDSVFLSWNKVTDAETPQNGLTYNVRVGKTPTGVEIMPPLAKVVGTGLGGGFRLVFGMGNTNHNNSWQLNGLPDGTFYWSVEAIDQVYRNSKFQTTANFTIDGPPAKIMGVEAVPGVNSATVKWNRDWKSDIHRYVVYGGTDPQALDSLGFGAGLLDTTETISGLTNGMIYYFKVLGIDNAGHVGEFSDVVSVIPTGSPGRWIVTTNNDFGPGSIAAMIDSANLTTQKDTILFDPSLSGQTILVGVALPSITTDFTYINADIDNNGTPDIIINGSNKEGYGSGLTLSSNNNVVKGFQIYGFQDYGSGISIYGSYNRILGNYIGNDGSTASRNYYGVEIYNSNHNWIGDGTAAGRNIISGNGYYGIYLSNSNDNQILGNYIGLATDGDALLGNGYDGIYFQATGSGNQVGNATAGGRNIISGNGSSNGGRGISMYDYDNMHNNSILGNYIGTDVTGMLDRGNAGDGIYLYSGGGESIVNTHIGNSTVEGLNIISGNDGHGVYIDGRDVHDNFIEGNFIGVAADGATPLGNGQYGVYTYEASRNTIANNVISGNNSGGVVISTSYYNISDNIVTGNKIGTDQTGTEAVGNAGYGVHVVGGYSGSNNKTVISNNLISGNMNSGITLGEGFNGYVYDTKIIGNYIGVNDAGTDTIPNGEYGIYIYNVNDQYTSIGDGTASGRNIISGNRLDGIWFEQTLYNEILGNYIGVDETGNAALPNGGSGIVLWNSGYNKIGDGTSGGRNIISGNTEEGIKIYAGFSAYSDYEKIYGNYVGVGANGVTPIGNGAHGVEIEMLGEGDYSRFDSIAYNVIAHNGEDGIYADGAGVYEDIWFGNSIFNNSGNGITVTNNAQYNIAPPRVDSVSATSILYGRAAPGALVHVYNDSDDEGGIFIDTVYADGSGNWSKRMKLIGGLNATAIQDSNDNSSAFSTALELPVGSLASIPSALNFGNVLVGDSVTQVLKVFANGGTVIMDSGYFKSGVNFNVSSSNDLDTLFYGDTMIVSVFFKPTAFGALVDSGILINNSSVNPFKIPLSGTGLAGTLASSLTSHNFGSVPIGDSASVNVKVYTSVGSVIVNSSTFASAMITANAGTLPRTLMPGDTMNVTVKFKPTVQATIAGDTLKLNNNSSVSPYRMVFSGTSVENIPPVITIGVLSLNIVNKYLGIYAHSNEGLISRSIAFTFNSAPVSNPPTLSDVPGQPNLFFTQFKLTAAGTLGIVVTATDSANNVTNQPKNYTVAALNKKEPLNVKVDEFILTSAKGVTDEDGFLVAGVWLRDPDEAQSGELGKRSSSEESFSEQSMTAVGAGLELLATAEIKQPVNVSLKYDVKAVEALKAKYQDFDERKIGLYREDAGQWIYEGGEGLGQSLTAKVQTAGKFAAFYNNEHIFLPKKVELSQNYPNPFNPTTTIRFGLPDEGRVKLSVYNILGQKVAELFDGFKQAGYHTALWDGKNAVGQQVSSGIYIYRIETPKGVSARKMMLIK
ncbi:FG-GAP-like repeat-containing protein [bacterium]|nr:FG-GAP-like repeat-containing protein [bacterium]